MTQQTQQTQLRDTLAPLEFQTLLSELNLRGVGYLKLAESLHIGKKTIYDLIGASVLKVDETNKKRKAYNTHLFSEIEYYIDIARIKRNSLLSHNYDTLKNFPLLVAIADKLGRIVYYDLIDFGSETDLKYFLAVIAAKLNKSKVIHLDIYSEKLFNELEKLGFRVCYVSKKVRIELLKASNKAAIPYYQQIEHNFANIQKYLRRLMLTVDLKGLDVATAKKLLEVTIQLYWFNNIIPLITLFSNLGLITQINLATLEAKKLEDNKQILVTV
jgi:hypothetical protein